METKVTIDMLTNESVSINTKSFIDFEGNLTEIKNHRIAYINSNEGREQLQAEQSEDTVRAILAIWGNEPVINLIESGK